MSLIRKAHVACDVSFIVKNEGVLKVTDCQAVIYTLQKWYYLGNSAR